LAALGPSRGISLTIFADYFPDLEKTGYQVTSPADWRYNCIAWAAGDQSVAWWPGKFYWPQNASCEETLAAFVQAFQTLGYALCSEGALEEGFEKVAIYAMGDAPKHAARQLANGRWSSKLGQEVDIEHVLEGVAGPLYGIPVCFLKRPRPT
jgi:hypothetical protein